jgi:hypothetical protein
LSEKISGIGALGMLVGSGTGAVIREPVSSPRRIARSMRICRTTRSCISPAALQRGEDVLTMSLRQDWDSRRQRSDEVLDVFGRFPGSRRILQERFERHPDHVPRSAAEAAGRPTKRTTQRGGQTDCDRVPFEDRIIDIAFVVGQLLSSLR